MPEKPERTASDILKDLHEFLCEPEEDFASLPMQKVDAVLDDAGVDARRTFRAAHELFAQGRAAELLSAGRRKQQLFSRLMDVYKNPVRDVTSKGKEALERLAAFSPGQEAVAFHKLEEATADDLASLADDLDLLEALNEADAELDES
jgi:hypothetical protein